MPQIVPSAGFTPPYCDYTAFTTDFDLSLLPESPISEVPFSPTTLTPFLSLYPTSPTFEDGIVCDNFGFVNDLKCSRNEEIRKVEDDNESLHTPLKKTPSSGFFNEKMEQKKEQAEKEYDFNSTLQFMKKETEEAPLIPTTVHATQASPSYYPITIKEEPMSYMMSSEFSSPLSPPVGTRLMSPQQSPINQPLSSPVSPATSYSSHSSYQRSLPPSPYGVKTEKTVDLQEILKESQYLQSVVRSERSVPSTSRQTETAGQFPTLQNLLKEHKPAFGGESAKPTDHQLLRSVLRDTSFQKKFNIKPFPFEGSGFQDDTKRQGNLKVQEAGESSSGKKDESSEMVEELTREKIEPVLSMAFEQLRKEVDNTCSVLGISRDPSHWSVEDVKSWLLWTIRQLSLPMIAVEYFAMDGSGLSQLSEEDFQQRAPQTGSILHAQLEIWKAASYGECPEPTPEYSSAQWSPTMHSSGSSTGGDLSEEEEEEMEQTKSVQGTSQAPSESQGSSSVGKQRGSGGSHIHLWQFLKELLASPQLHGSCIRWLDRQKGVFKIEDSVRVARLWGKRKNRPAMNYDKLSRSIRQYYKKGIMKKTERSQRLVYQFCHPYCL